MDLIGQRFGHICVTGVVGQGGMGEVYAGYDEALQRKVALKILRADHRLDDEARERLLREARALSRLDHPNICRIHDYIESGDSDLLVLEYIDGLTLDDVLNAKMPRAEKLRVAVSVAEVLVAAHRAGIVHRDLKPENVMLTKAGEVKVLDFGLARWLQKPRAAVSETRLAAAPPLRAAGGDDFPAGLTASYPPPARALSAERGALATAVGVTMGTPLYMSPEQARGEPLTPASDMFSFGLLLQVLFSGRDAHPPELSSREVMLRVAGGETDAVHGVTGDVTALINRLKMTAPTDRPTAVETLERLRSLADQPRRLARRGIIAALLLIALTGAWRYTVDLRRERSAAVAARAVAVTARAEAERRRGQAEDLIDFMMGDLHHKLEPIGRLDVLDAASDRAMAYMSSLRPELMSAGELAQNATALQHLGEVRIAQGKLPDALKAFEQALLIARSAVQKEPASLPARFTLGQTQFYVGEAHRLMGHQDAALAGMRDYLATSEALVRAAPDNPDYRLELAYGYSNVGSLLEARGDLAGALGQYERCLVLKQARLRDDPANPDWQADLARTVNKIGSVLQQQGRLSRARARFSEEKAIYASLVRAAPKHMLWKNRLVTSETYLGTLLADLGELDAAAEELAAAQAIADELVAFDPQQVMWRRDLGVILGQAASVERMRGRLPQSLALVARGEALLRQAIRESPQRTEWQRDLANLSVRHAEALYAAGHPAAAESRAEAVVASVPKANAEPQWRQAAADASILLGRIDGDRGRPAAARADWERAVEALRDSRSGSLRLADRRARALLLLGRDEEARPILEELRRAEYANPDLNALAARRGPHGS